MVAQGLSFTQAMVIAALVAFAAPHQALAQTDGHTATKSYDARLLRLSEILGAVHHLREICGANEGQLWRDQMTDILQAEEPPAILRRRMVAAFNMSYRGYQRTYGTCTQSAKTAANRFFSEGMAITKGLASEIGAGDIEETAEKPAASEAQLAR